MLWNSLYYWRLSPDASQGNAMKRYALVTGHNITTEKVSAYLPSNYAVIHTGDTGVVIQGTDNRGWTLDKYVIPRLGSGNMNAVEIDLSHDVMKEIS
jgi:hypothetical protein